MTITMCITMTAQSNGRNWIPWIGFSNHGLPFVTRLQRTLPASIASLGTELIKPTKWSCAPFTYIAITCVNRIVMLFAPSSE